MNNFTLTTFLTSNIDIDKDVLDELIQNCKHITIQKGNFLLQQGEICKHSFFVEHGLLRHIFDIDNKGKEHILQFAPETWFISDRGSVYFNRPSDYFIQALESSTLFQVDENFIVQTCRTKQIFPEVQQ